MELSLFKEFKNIIVLDTETSGLDFKNDEIIELAMLRVCNTGSGFQIMDEYDEFIRLSPGRVLPEKITELTNITPQMLETQGLEKAPVCRALEKMFSVEKPLVVAYNSQFDMCFLYYFLAKYGDASVLRNIKMLDAMTVYKDRRPFPHKLCNAIEEYNVDAVNSHRAIDDTKAAFKLLVAMAEEKDDLLNYINLFGYSPKYGVSGSKISSVTYKPQGFQPRVPLYEL